MIHAAKSLSDLKSPGASLEALIRERIGQHGIRINDQYRICFVWRNAGAHEVEITDYHQAKRSAHAQNVTSGSPR